MATLSEKSTFIGAVNVSSTEVKCPGCGASIGLKFDQETLDMTCPFCGLVSKLPHPGSGPAIQELDFNSALQRASVNWGNVKKMIVCGNCGGQTIFDAEQVTGACPFCGSTSVTPAAENSQIMAPQAVIPFGVSREQVQLCFDNFINSSHVASKKIIGCKLENIVGIYLPFWTYDTLAVSHYFAHHSETKYTPRQEFQGVLNQFYDDLVIYGSDKIRNANIKRVQDFDFQRMVPYTPKYLAGIPAERYTVGLNDGWERAKEQIRQKTRRTLQRKFFMKAAIDAIYTSYYNVTFRYVLAPIYLATYKCGGKTQTVAINGQTGKTYCKYPTFLGKLVVIPLIVMLAVLALFFFTVIVPEIR
ncbi:MAG: TFIIB-type zinc ribbon-containing protein [Clostridiales bacterium]|nr:TFIIB-type zinc ribbon-containing protein [Clostridiales bacterium]